MVNVDKVYQKILVLANKEQRGYITPQEFNLLADHAQMDIFEQYFYDLDRMQRIPGSEQEYADLVTNLEEKISMFEKNDQIVSASGAKGEILLSSAVEDFYRLGSVSASYEAYTPDIYGDNVSPIEGQENFCDVEYIKLSELRKYEKSPLAKPTKSRPIYTQYSTVASPFTIRLYPALSDADTCSISYIRRPKSPNWTYLISTGESKNALYNPSAMEHQHFELHSSEESNLVIKILQLAGISIKDLQLAGVMSQEEMKGLQQEKR